MTSNSPRAIEDLVEVSVPASREGDRQVRLSLSLSPVIADVLKGYAAGHGITITETVRRAASVLSFIEEIKSEPDAALAVAHGSTVREVKFPWDN